MDDGDGTRSRKVTLKDVAQLAGVSVATASKALNGRANVHPDTRRRVVETAERLAFTPNTLAQNLLSGQSGTVGLVTNDLEGRFSIPILMGAEDAFGAGKTSIFLCDAREDPIRESYHLQALLGRRVDGLIIVGSRTDPRPPVPDVPVPVVYVYAPSENPADLSFVPDNVGAGRQAAEHLITLGRRRIAHIAGDPTYAAARDRVQGVDEAMAAAGLELVDGHAAHGTWSESWGRAATRTVLDRSPDVDAIVCGSDQIARGVLDTLRDLGRDVPRDVSVVSFDNWEILATGARPQLTSVDMSFERLGRRAAQAIFDAMDGKTASGVHTEPCRLVVRGSSLEGA
ncbi:transcriptional regulator, LacI family [Georgenia satyanarayanai]|uniref:Transcriptional regulator, LacI family n=1 Tax=Georgenia satyanarayanai TaxID=860221 RepID=A0A2Y9AFZ7_9MICO|nr:LacI family DNA-binding transcriptional regulator [Georgenia satyanarayanai]PYF99313.1 LacI family transcriptional regulator [Georgenia satyanarayanai]SSA43125.1 transcriptional regulator, LacI family [Georgenia satyanarayanai]